MRIGFAGFMLIPLFVAAVACGGDDSGPCDGVPSATATAVVSAASTITATAAVPETASPEPGLFIVDPASGQGTQATPGTRCWGGGCVDFLGPLTRDAPFSFNRGAELDWQVEGGAATEVAHSWVAGAGVQTEDAGDGTLLWRVPDLQLDETGGIAVPAQAGEYLLVVFIRYGSGDDVLWGLYVNAE